MSSSRYSIIEDKPQSESRYKILEDDTHPENSSILEQPTSYPDQKPIGALERIVRAGSIFGQDVKKIPGAIGDEIVNDLNKAPTEIGGAAHQLFHDPLRYAKNELSSAGKLYQSGERTLPDVVQYMAHLGMIPQKAGEVAGEVSRGMRNPIDIAPKDEKQPGDALLQSAAQIASSIVPAKEMASLAGKGLSMATKPVRNFVTGAPKYAALAQNLGIPVQTEALNSAEKIAQQAQVAHGGAIENKVNALDELKSAKENATRNGVSTSSASIENNLNNSKSELNDLNNNITALNHIMDNKPQLPELPPTNTSHLEEAHNASLARSDAEHNYNLAQNNHEEAKGLESESKNAISEHLNPNQEHAVRLAKQVTDYHEPIRKGLNADYENIKEEFKKHDVTFKNEGEIHQKTQDMIDRIKESKIDNEETKVLVGKLQKILETPIAKADEFLSAYRSVTDYARKARQRAYTPGVNSAERDALIEHMNNLDIHADKMGEALESAVGEENYADLKKANTAWRTKVIPLQRNPIYQRAKKYNVMPDNTIKALRGDTEPGNQLIKQSILSNPEITKNAVAQRYFSGPKGANAVHNPNETMQEYLNNTPELGQMLEQHKQVQAGVTNAKNAVARSKESHVNSISAESSAQNIANTKEKEINTQLKQHEAASKTIQNEKDALQKQLGEHTDKAKELEAKIPLLDRHHDELVVKEKQYQDKIKNVRMNLKQHLSAKKNLSDIQSSIKNAKSELDNAKFGYKFLTNKIPRALWSAIRNRFH
jgi:hypothetical protein